MNTGLKYQTTLLTSMRHSFVSVPIENDADQTIRIHCVEEKTGSSQKLLILLHGFPQYWYVWKPYMRHFSKLGFHVVAPDMRGFNKSEKPTGKSSYAMKYLINDVLELITHYEYEKVTIVGHDWGGSVVWEIADQYPDKIEAAVVINSPHRGAYAMNIQKSTLLNLRQTLRSWYIYFFQIPFIPEWVMRFKNFAWLEHNFRSWTTVDDAFSKDDIEQYKAALRIPGALTAAINYYRANTFGEFGMGVIKASMGKKVFEEISVPSLLIWGDQDPPLDKHLTDNMNKFFSGEFKSVHIHDGSHWVLHEHPNRVIKEIVSFLKECDQKNDFRKSNA